MVAVCKILILFPFLTESSPVKTGQTTLVASALLCTIISDFDDEVTVARSRLIVKLAFTGGFHGNRGNPSGSATAPATHVSKSCRECLKSANNGSGGVRRTCSI